MQLRCTYCQTMFALSRDEMLAALEHLEEQKLKYYDAHCPKCRRANRVERLKLELAYPNWKSDLKALAKQAAAPAAAQKSAAASKEKGSAPAKKSGAAPQEKASAPAKKSPPATTGAKTKSGAKQP